MEKLKSLKFCGPQIQQCMSDADCIIVMIVPEREVW